MLTYKESDCVVVNKHIVLRDEKSLEKRRTTAEKHRYSSSWQQQMTECKA